MSNWTVEADNNFVESNFSFNHIVASSVITFAFLFIVLLFIARTMDKDDLRKVGATKLLHKPSPRLYRFVLILYTGTKKKASTTANIFCELKGILGNSGYIPLRDNKRKIFQRGDINAFIITLSKYIGRLKQLYIWSDASGSQSSWYLKRAVLYDVDRKGAYYFYGSRWFDVYEGEGKVDGTLLPRTKESTLLPGRLCREKFFKELRNNHIWFAPFTKICKDKFTRVQRLMCCLSFFLTLIFFVTLLEYADQINISGITEIGSLSIGHLQFVLGFIASLLSQPIRVLVTSAFVFTSGKEKINSFYFNRRERIRRKYVQHEEIINSVSERSVHFANDEANDPSNITGAAVVTVPISKPWRISQRWQFLAWTTCGVISTLSLLGTLLLSAFFSLRQSFSWIQSCITALISSALITEPDYLFLHSLYFAICVKRPAYEEDIYPELNIYEKEFEEEHEEEEETKVVEIKGQDAIVCGLKPPSEEQVTEAREKVSRDRELGEVFKMLLFNVLFLGLLAVVSLGNRDPSSFELKTALDESFNKGNIFKSITDTKTFWNWTEESLIPGLFVKFWYNEWPIHSHSTGQIANKENFMIGTPIIRQKRVVKDTCILSDFFYDIIEECNDFYTYENEDTTSFAAQWRKIDPNDAKIVSQSPWEYQNPDVSNTSYSIWGKIARYNGGGYVAYLGNGNDYAKKMIKYLKTNQWIDRYTRAVFVEFATYNGNLNLLGIFELIVEFHNNGGARPRLRSYTLRMFRYMDDSQLIFLVAEIIFAVFILQHFYKIMGKISVKKWKFFKNFWNWTDLVLIVSSFSMVILYALRMVDLQAGVELLDSRRYEHHNEDDTETSRLFEKTFHFYSFYKVAVWEEYIAYVSSMIFLIPILQFMKFMRFNKNFKIFYATLGHCTADLMSLGVFFLISLTAFSILAIFLLVTSLETFSTFPGAFSNTIGMILGKYSFKFFIDYSQTMGMFFVFAFTIVHVFLLMNIVLTLISVMFVHVKNDEKYNKSEYEIVKFLVIKTKVFLKLDLPPPVLDPVVPLIIRKPTNFAKLHWNFHSKYILETQNRRIRTFINDFYVEDLIEDIVLVTVFSKLQFIKHLREKNLNADVEATRTRTVKPRMHCVVTDDIL